MKRAENYLPMEYILHSSTLQFLLLLYYYLIEVSVLLPLSRFQLEAMGFDRELVLEVFFACNKNEELAANYLLDHMHEFEE